MMPNRKNNPGFGILEIMAAVLVMSIAFLSLFNLQRSSGMSLEKAGEFMIAGAVLHNTSELYKIKPFAEITDTISCYDDSGNEVPTGQGTFQVKIGVEAVVMPNKWAAYKRISLEVEKRGTFFGTTLLKTALLRTAMIEEP